MKKMTILFLIISAVYIQAGEKKFNELSGVIKKTVKSDSKYKLVLDGCTGSFYFRGKILDNIPEGTRIWVKEYIKTELFKSNIKAKNSSPFFTHWMIFMEVHEYKITKKPFEK